jgi:acyl carrier protein
MTTLERIQSILRNTLEDDTLIIDETTRQSDVRGWDSLAQIRIIMALELEFKMKFSTKDIMNLQSVGDFIQVINK